MTKCPRTNSWTTAYDLTYDAWNRLIRIRQGAATVGTYTYDGLNRRVTKVAGGVTRHYYYSDQWQILEERTGTSSCAERQYVWGLRYIDDLIVRDRATSSSSSSSSCPAMNERLYVLHDYFSVTAVTNSSGTVLERYGYDAFGESRVMTSSFGSRATSSYDWDVRYGAYRWDSESDFYQVRYRYLHPALGRWLSRDPLGEEGGLNLYGFVYNNPLLFIDVLGCDPNYAISTGIDGSVGLGLQVGGGISFDITRSPCPSGSTQTHSYKGNVKVSAFAGVGIGLKGKVKVGGKKYGVDLSLSGPRFTGERSAFVEKDCCGRVSGGASGEIIALDWKFNPSISGSIGIIAFAASFDGSVKGGIEYEVVVSSSGIVGRVFGQGSASATYDLSGKFRKVNFSRSGSLQDDNIQKDFFSKSYSW